MIDLQTTDEAGRPMSIGAIVGKIDPSEFLRVVDFVRELEANPGWQLLDALLRADHAKAVHRATEGTLSGIEAYAHSAGFIKGLRRVVEAREHLLRTAVEVAAELDTGEGE